MRISSIKLRQFRNISSLELNFDKNLNVFIGDNGQGKTNFIESIVYLSSGRSFRLQNDLGLIKANSKFAEVSADITKKSENTHLRAVISEEGKYFQVNHQSLGLMSDFIGNLNVVLFNPDDLQFFSSTPRKRRREIDFELGKISKKYMDHLSLASKLLSERNAYLKTNNIDHDYLNIISDQLINESVYVIRLRKALVDRIEPIISEKYCYLSDSNSKIELEYKAAIADYDNIEEDLKEKMNASLNRDLDFKMTHVGVHRDDYIFKIDGIPVNEVASQGQKRMIILSYKLALVDLIYKSEKEYPILCLDDLFSELDKERRSRVLNSLNQKMQVFISSTDLEFIDVKDNISVFNVSAGEITKEVSA